MAEYNHHLWSGYKCPFEHVLDLGPQSGDTVNIFLPEEYEINPDWTEGKYDSYFKDNNIKVNLVVGSNDLDFYSSAYLNFNVIPWETFFIQQSYVFLKETKFKIKPKQLFVSMNVAPRHHRCMLVDNIFKNGLEEYGYISWHGTPDSLDHDYKWEYWKTPKVLQLDKDQNPNNVANHKWNLPKQFFQTAINIVSETSPDIMFLTEKTAIPLFMCKPLLIQGRKGFHKYLQELGFELYTEIFDYSFDDKDTVEERTAGIIENLLNLKTRSPKEIYALCKDKAVRNRNVVIDIANNKNLIPEIVKTNILATERYRKFLR